MSQVLAAGMNYHLSTLFGANHLLLLMAKYLCTPKWPSNPTDMQMPMYGKDWSLLSGLIDCIMEGDLSLFMRLLQLFIEQQSSVVERVREALCTGAREEASHRLHNLCGGGAQIGVLDLSRAASEAQKGHQGRFP